MGFTESQDTSQRERENENGEQAGGPDQGEPPQQAEQHSASAWKDFIDAVKCFMWLFLQYLSYLIAVLSIVVRPDKNTIVKEDNADRTVPVNTLDVNDENEKDFLKNNNKGNVQSGSAKRTVAPRGCDIVHPQDQMGMEHNLKSEKMNPVHMTQGTITMVTESNVSECSRSSDQNIHSTESLKTVNHRKPQTCQGGSQAVIDSSRTCCLDRAFDHIENKATQTPKDYGWFTDVEGVKQERDCMVNSNTEKQSDPTQDSSAVDSKTEVMGGFEASKGVDNTSSILPEVDEEETAEASWKMMEKHQVEGSRNGCYKKDDSCPSDRKSRKSPSGEEGEEEGERFEKDYMLTEVQGDINKKEKSSLSDGNRNSSCHDEKSDEGNCEKVEKDLLTQSEGDLCKKDNSCPSDRKSRNNPSGEEDEDWGVVGKEEILTEAQGDVNKKERSSLSDGENSSSCLGEKSKGNCEKVEKDLLTQSEGCKKDNSCPSDRKSRNNPCGEEDEDWEVVEKEEMLTEVQGDVNKKEKSSLTDGKRGFSPLDEKCDEGRCEMMEKDQPAQSEGDLCKKDNPCPSDWKCSRSPSGEENKEYREVFEKGQMLTKVQGNVNKEEKSSLCDGNRSSSHHDEKSKGKCEMVAKDQPAQSKGDPCKKDNSCPSDKKSSNNPSGEEDWEVIEKEEMLKEVQGDVNKKERSSLSDGKRGFSPLDEKSDEDSLEVLEKHQVEDSQDAFYKKDSFYASDRESSKNPSGEEGEDGWEVVGKDQKLTEAQGNANKKEKFPVSKRERSSSPHRAKSYENNCKIVEIDQPVLSEGEDDWEMIDKAQLTDIQDDVYKKGKSCLSGGKRCSSPLHGETDEDRCDMMEKDQLERMEKDQLEEPDGSLYMEDNACLPEEKEKYCPLDETDIFMQVKRPDGSPEYYVFGQNSLADETGYFSEVSLCHQGIDLKVPPLPQRDEVDQFSGKDDNVLMRRKCEKDPFEAATSGASPPLKNEVDQFCGKDGNVLMWRKFEKEAHTSGATPPLKNEVDQFCGKDDNAHMWRKCEKDLLEAGTGAVPPPLEDDEDQFCGKDVLMWRKFEKQDPLKAGASGARPKERFSHSCDKTILPCTEYFTQNYWQQIILQEGEIGWPFSEPCVSDYWLQMVIQECNVMWPEEDGACSWPAESTTEGGRLLTFCSEYP